MAAERRTKGSRRLGVAILLAVGITLALGCDPDGEEEVVDDGCPDDSMVTYENFGEPFLLTWCVSCHSSWLAAADRQEAPDGVDFDTYSGFAQYADTAAHRSTTDEMPPAGGPTDDERARLAEWVACGAPE